MTVLEDAKELQPELVELRRALHRQPELGLHLPRTQERVLAALDGQGIELATGRALSSVTGVVRGRGGPGRTVLLRGDMDALPVAEVNDLPFRSENGAMHACGHDLHTAMVVGAARLLAARADELAGEVVLMLQPGEEGEEGARHMIEEGVLDAGSQPVSAAFALHVTPALLPAGIVVSRPGPMLSAVDTLHVTVRGRGGHSSAPHRASDPIPAACEMVTALQTMVTRRFDVFDPVVVTVGTFQAGTQDNVIPDDADFKATIRSFSAPARERAARESVQLCQGIARAHGLEVEARIEQWYPVTVNDRGEQAVVADLVKEVRAGSSSSRTRPLHRRTSRSSSTACQAPWPSSVHVRRTATPRPLPTTTRRGPFSTRESWPTEQHSWRSGLCRRCGARDGGCARGADRMCWDSRCERPTGTGWPQEWT